MMAQDNREDIDYNLKTIERDLKTEDADFLVYPEAFLQGFQSFNFDYEEDVRVALSQRSAEIAQIQRLAKDSHKAIGFGYYENDHGGLYSSFMVIDKSGECVYNYKRISKGWKERKANADYREGKDFGVFELEGIKFSVVLCGDFWEEDLYDKISDISCDILLWPAYTDYDVNEWENEIRDEYIEHTALVAMPVAYVNAYISYDEERAKGGAFFAKQGKPIKILMAGNKGKLDITI